MFTACFRCGTSLLKGIYIIHAWFRLRRGWAFHYRSKCNAVFPSPRPFRVTVSSSVWYSDTQVRRAHTNARIRPRVRESRLRATAAHVGDGCNSRGDAAARCFSRLCSPDTTAIKTFAQIALRGRAYALHACYQSRVSRCLLHQSSPRTVRWLR